MSVLPDFGGVGGSSLKQSALNMLGAIFLLVGGIMGACIGIFSMNQYFIFDVLLDHLLLGWFGVIDWTMWFICIVWGFIAVSMPCRPRDVKQKALSLLIVFLVLLIVTHGIWTVMFCYRCHYFFLNSLAGNVAKETIETFSDRITQNKWIDKALYIAVPVLNWISAPYVYQLYQQLPPLNLLFLCGWNWAIFGFLLGVIPIALMSIAVVVILGYKHAIERGGDGSENVAPSQIADFYALPYEDRCDIRLGLRKIEDFQYSDLSDTYSSSSDYSESESPEEEGSGGTGSGSRRGESVSEEDNKNVKRIPSYKPNRRVGVV
jgi:hypothetical protein